MMFDIGQKVRLTEEGDQKFISLRRYDIIYKSEYGVVISNMTESCIVKFELNSKFQIVDIPNQYLEKYDE